MRIVALLVLLVSNLTFAMPVQVVPRQVMLEEAPRSSLCDKVAQLEKNNDRTPRFNPNVYFVCRGTQVSAKQIKACAKAAAFERNSNGTIRFSESTFDDCVKLDIPPAHVKYCTKAATRTRNATGGRTMDERVFKACLDLAG